MPTYIYKGGKHKILNGVVLRNYGDEIELNTLVGLIDANRFALKQGQSVVVKKPTIQETKKFVIPDPVVAIEKNEKPIEKLEKIEPKVKTKGGITNG